MNKNSLFHRINAIVLMLVGALMLLMSWGKWMDAWVDFGDDLFIQWKIVHGAVLYKDIAYFRGPFPIYLNAALFKFFGTGIYTLVFAQLLMVVAATVLTYLFFFETAGLLAAFTTSLVFLTLFVCPQYLSMGNFNFICPYTYAIVDGYVCAILGLFIFLKFLKNGSGALLFLLGLVAGIIFLIKVEIFIAFFLAITAGIILWDRYLRKTDQYGLIRAFLILLAGAMIPFGMFLVYFSQYMPWTQALHALTLQYTPCANIAKDVFYLTISGLGKPYMSIMRLLDWAAVYFTTIVLIAAFVFIFVQAKVNPSLNRLKILFFILLEFILLRGLFSDFFNIFSPLPLVVAVFCVLSERAFVKEKSATPQTVGLSVFAFFALFLLVKIILNVTITGYGFVLALPAVLLLVVMMVQFLPKILGDFFHDGENFVRCVFLVLISVVIIFYVHQSKSIYDLKTFKIAHGQDRVMSYNPLISGEGLQFQRALDFVNTKLNPKETFLVLPEGTLLNYLSRKDTGTHYFKISFAEEDVWTEDAILQDFQQHPPDYILYKFWRRFGPGHSGAKIISWIHANYRRVKVVYASGQEALFIDKRK